ncbi:MAG: Stp1/IreP family PP2C-type Ser/Thr phosphatase [Lachnospiraceae bacterium]|nr:Stp1/IreP family PP2C-type Ser/Thr phosphatase [Lachnospiraceae bacterium]
MTRVYLATDIGPSRELNEDAVAALDCETYVVADGMGGYTSGEVASHMLVDTVREALAAKGHFDEMGLKDAMLCANEEILKSVQNHPAYAGMGTTATMFHREERDIVWAHVGDSRLYLLRGGILRQITRDHSLVSELVANGSITPEEAMTHPKRNVITRAVGVTEELMVDVGRFPWEPGDLFLLSTDGLTSVLSEETLCSLLLHEMIDGKDVAKVLVNAAIEAGSHDNISAVVVVYDA